MADESHGVLRSLEDVGVRRRDGVRRVGRKAYVLSNMVRAGLPVPEAWVLDVRHYTAFLEARLPRKHDLKTLIKLAGTRRGDDHCARAFDELLREPIDDAITSSVQELWDDHFHAFEAGVAVRPSFAASGDLAGDAARHLHSLVGLDSPDAIVAAIRRVWASSVLSSAVAGFATAEVRDVAVALLLQRAVTGGEFGMLARTPGLSEPVADSEWHIGVMLDAHDEGGWLRRGQLFAPMSLGEGAESIPAPVRSLHEALGARGFEQLLEIGEAAERALGRSAVLHFNASEKGVQIIAVDESPRWQTFRAAASSVWCEVTMAARPPEPPTKLSSSLCDGLVRGALERVVSSLHCSRDDDVPLVQSWNARSYLNLSEVMRAGKDVPLLTPEALLHAIGGANGGRGRKLVGATAAASRSRFRGPMIASAALRQQLSLEGDIATLERGIQRDARGLGEMDLTLLPNDALATTLTGARTLLERAGELWAQCSATYFIQHTAARALVARRTGEAPHLAPYTIASGRGQVPFAAMVRRAEGVVRAIAEDDKARAYIESHDVLKPSDLPDGRARGALGQFLANYGEIGCNAFELAQPRWREDASTLVAMLKLLASAEGFDSVQRIATARAVSDAELARYEGELTGMERALLRRMVDRSREVVAMRARVDRLLYRVAFLVRRVVCDIDRRLRRIDTTIADGGTFHCGIDTLVAALKSGRPELGRIIAMREVERAHLREAAVPPLGFIGTPPRSGVPLMQRRVLEGIGVSAGVAEGRVRRVGRALPGRIDPGDVLLLASADPARVILYPLAGAIIAETGGALSLAAEAARELAVPAVFSAQEAGLHLSDGELVRVDGEHGTISRVGSP